MQHYIKLSYNCIMWLCTHANMHLVTFMRAMIAVLTTWLEYTCRKGGRTSVKGILH